MSILEDVLSQPTGARFFRADLHIHSFGASHDVKDSAMTATAIVQTAAKEGLSVIAITDHNEIANVEGAINASKGTSVTVIPAVELSTPQGHLLCYLPTLDELRRFHGKLSVVDRGTQNSRCQQSLFECLNLLHQHSGFGVLAHVDIDSGYEMTVPGASPHKSDVICHAALLGIELKHATSTISYAVGDDNADRAKMGQDRIARLNLGTKQFLARVLNSDAHALAALGRNAANQSRMTRYKMDAPSFDGLRVALEDADARVRIEDQIPTAVPRFLGIKFEGGFLADQIVQFSPNLNCIIGGRGTGKSTAFEAVRCLAGDGSGSKVIDSEVWPDELHLFWQDPAGQVHSLIRRKEGPIENIDDELHGPCTFEVDCFGQGEAARISHEAQDDPLALLRYLDKFVDLDEAVAEEEAAHERLLALQTKIEETERKVDLIPQYERALSTTQQQLKALQKPGVAELIELQRQLAAEKEVRNQILEKMQEAEEGIDGGTTKTTVEDIRLLSDPQSLSVGGTEFGAIREGALAFETTISTAETQIKAGLAVFEKIVTAQMMNWRAKENEAQKKVDEKRRELEVLKVPFDMSYITKLTKDEASHQQNINKLTALKPHLTELRKSRLVALRERWAAREKIATLRDTFGRQASATLRESLSDLQVSLKYTRNAYSPEAADLLIEIMDWRTNQHVRAGWLVETLTIPALLDAIKKNDARSILALKTPEDVPVFKKDEAKLIIERLSAPAIQFQLERVMLHDLPRLLVTRAVPDGKGGKHHMTRDFSKLSLGQQQSVLLALILSAESTRPLIIDQPEDNLDGEFIYSTLVPVLRRAKERRQVIIVTHNPNVAVLGDAELIVVMKAMSDHGSIVARGSIDDNKTRDSACAILEGAKEAFLRRARMYGIKLRDQS
jgi:DNA repair ATPase RecN/histidinol phosphatase-like PHP family hydrolase